MKVTTYPTGYVMYQFQIGDTGRFVTDAWVHDTTIKNRPAKVYYIVALDETTDQDYRITLTKEQYTSLVNFKKSLGTVSGYYYTISNYTTKFGRNKVGIGLTVPMKDAQKAGIVK